MGDRRRRRLQRRQDLGRRGGEPGHRLGGGLDREERPDDECGHPGQATPGQTTIVGSGDFNHDGTSDIVVRNPAAGSAFAWITGKAAHPTTYYHYDPNGNLDGVEDARGIPPGDPENLRLRSAHTTKYVYDESDRKTQTIPARPQRRQQHADDQATFMTRTAT